MMLSFAFSQAQILSEGFESATFPPTGWTTSNTNASRPWGLTTVIFNATGQATFNITGQSAAGRRQCQSGKPQPTTFYYPKNTV